MSDLAPYYRKLCAWARLEQRLFARVWPPLDTAPLLRFGKL